MSAFDTIQFDGITVDELRSPIPDRVLGKEQTLSLGFRPAGRATGFEQRYLSVREYGEYAGTADVGRLNGGGIYVRESVAASAPVASLVVPIEPVPSDSGGPFEGIWGLVTGMTDGNRLPNRFVLDVDVTYLGDRSEYADRAALKTALGSSPL